VECLREVGDEVVGLSFFDDDIIHVGLDVVSDLLFKVKLVALW
jgi:hypothetical protein